MFLNLSIKKKLFFLCSTLLMFSFIAGFVSYRGLIRLDANLRQISQNSIPEILTIDSMYLEFTKTRVALRTIGLLDIDEKQAKESIQKVHENILAYEKFQAEYEKTLKTNEQKEIFISVQKVEHTVNSSKTIFEKYVRSSNDKVKNGNQIINECENNLNNILN